MRDLNREKERRKGYLDYICRKVALQEFKLESNMKEQEISILDLLSL